MTHPPPHLPLVPNGWEDAIQSEWERAKPFFKRHSHVVMFSLERFWEAHGFVQQSLAYLLADEGLSVTWIDGRGWRRYRPTVNPTRPNLRVTSLRQLPLRRVPKLNVLSRRWEARQLLGYLKAASNPLFWIWGGCDEALLESLPAPDIYSVFDNPYGHLPDGLLGDKARIITCQNSFATALFSTKQKQKTHRVFPPVSLSLACLAAQPLAARAKLPKHFPNQVLGYVGSHLGEGLDFSLIEQTLVAFPSWGVLLVGRTDELGESKLLKLARYPNFHRVAWCPREEALAYWDAIDVAFFPYAELMSQDGAFAVKTLEALHRHKPVFSTRVPKTEDFEGLIHFFSSLAELRSLLESKAVEPPTELTADFWALAKKLHPKQHLTVIARLFS